MSKRKIIEIDEERCTGCGACAEACHEGAIGMVNHKAKLLRDDYCDGLGDCLPTCPADAIHFVEREAAPYNQAAVQAHMAEKQQVSVTTGGCPGQMARVLRPTQNSHAEDSGQTAEISGVSGYLPSQLSQWPVQIRLVPVAAPYFQDASLLIAADCTAYAYAAFHERFIKGRITLVGCPKLDAVDYREKLTEILHQNTIRDITLVRMEVPCCGGLEMALKAAVEKSGKDIPCHIVVISTDGRILCER